VSASGLVLEKWVAPQVFEGETRDYSAPIYAGDLKIGDLSVSGVLNDHAEMRLKFQAALISDLRDSEQIVEEIVIDYIDVRDQFLALYKLVRTGWAGYNLEETAYNLTREIACLLMAEEAFLFLEFPDQNQIFIHYPDQALGPWTIREYVDCLGDHISPRVFRLNQEFGRQKGEFRELMLVPLRVQRAEKAVLGLTNKTSRQFKTPDMKIAETIGAFAAVQIDNALLYRTQLQQARLQTEMEMARNIQKRLLPRELPSVSGLDVWAISRPASQIGGDFYDFFYHNGGEVIFTVGDVSGKGLPAAMLMTMIRANIRSKFTISYQTSPASILEQANHDLYDDFSSLNMFATVFMGHYNPEERHLRYANAGHSPVILSPANDSARLIIAGSTPLCVLRTNSALNQHIDLQPGDVLLVGSDGLNEARNTKDEMLGYDRLLNIVDYLSDQPAQRIAQALISEVDSFKSGNNQEDDETIVILKVNNE
jgi:sigma-B regulation protein RsbU (phosphoserine phosphatase)